jgi:hypothetical protein
LVDEPQRHRRDHVTPPSVHGYLQIDVDRVHAVLNQHLEQLREFARYVQAHLSRVNG